MTRGTAAAIVCGMTSSGGRSHGPAVRVWHALCALGMVGMVLPAPLWFPRAAFLLFAAGVVWCGVRGRREGADSGDRAAYLGLGVCCLAMAVMLVPALDWVVGSAGAGMPVAPVGHAAMRMSSGAGGPTAHASVPTALLVVLALALTVVSLRAVARSAASVRNGSGHAARAEALAEALLAAAMAAMLAITASP